MVIRAPTQRQAARNVWKIGTKMMVQTLATNCPADLQTATASLILLQQQRITMKKKQPIPMRVHPMGSL